MFTITGLDPRTSYMIKAMAVNREKLLGPPVNIDVVTTIPQGKECYDSLRLLCRYNFICILLQVLVFFSMVCSMVTTAL